MIPTTSLVKLMTITGNVDVDDLGVSTRTGIAK
jgi:hypothetical protein